MTPVDENREKFWEPLINGALKLSKIWISHLKAPNAPSATKATSATNAPNAPKAPKAPKAPNTKP